ncbi:hypothetical protein CAL12_02880 [Bordetella genomosp. 8]|uniref:Uncharacterized protein n=1 Tax=Bordetella genomosp. 8 TaxID=1416806 RepID=A0A1W6YFS7_9BORD|nr:LamB/YcsF family protein [Bordetella genomosp. 8]ARP79870.1 hypothetical protein CAL12_02880 [Bordetella genomosp. 8]
MPPAPGRMSASLPVESPAVAPSIDLAAELRADADLLDAISTGYVACGTQPGDADAVSRILRTMNEKGIAIGANPSYPGGPGGGQRPADLDDVVLRDIILGQIAHIAVLALRAGARLSTVRCQGTLGWDMAYDERTAQVVARTVHQFDPALSLVCTAASPGARVAWDCGVTVVQEVCLDRAYDSEGRLIEPETTGAAVRSPADAVARWLAGMRDGRLDTMGGGHVRVRADSYCLNGDTPNAVAIARELCQSMRAHGVAVRPPRRALPTRPAASPAGAARPGPSWR